MTGYTVHTGASKKFVTGWDKIFSGENAQKKTPEKKKKAAKAARKKKGK